MDKIKSLAAAAKYDVCGFGDSPVAPQRFIYKAALPRGGCTSLLKILLTNACVNDCAYCVNQAGRDVPRNSFKPDELARAFIELTERRRVDGLFLSSGIGSDANRTMGAMVDTVEILRHRYAFNGYIHLKILPGARYDVIEAGCRLASRVSVNIEAPTAKHLARLSRKKDLHDGILERMRWVKQLTDQSKYIAPAGQTTQFVVGAAGETDGDIVHTTTELYREMGLKRVYFSAFRPVSHSRLEDVPAAPAMREHRLYEIDWLLRVYGFSANEVELALEKNENLSLKKDPKMTIASKQPWLYPVDLNNTSYDELLRVPGIGPVSARRIVDARKVHSIDSMQQLKKMGVATNRALNFIWMKGLTNYARQMSFLEQMDEATEETEEREPVEIIR